MTKDTDPDEGFAEAFDRREIARMKSSIAVSIIEARREAENERVAALISRDQADRYAASLRKASEIEFADGKRVDLSEISDGPTPEQIAQAEMDGVGFTKFVPRLRDGTVKTQIAFRRRSVPQAFKMMRAGVIDLEGYVACEWMRDLYEATGLSGGIPSTQYDKEVFAPPQSRAMFFDWQIDKQHEFRWLRKQIKPRHMALLEAMVLHDMPINRAIRHARAFHRRRKPAFREAVEMLISAKSEFAERD